MCAVLIHICLEHNWSTRDQTLKENCLSLSSIHQLSISPQLRVVVLKPHLHVAMLTCLFLSRSCADRHSHHELMNAVVLHIQKSFTQVLPVLWLLNSSILPSWALNLKKRVCGLDAPFVRKPRQTSILFTLPVISFYFNYQPLHHPLLSSETLTSLWV